VEIPTMQARLETKRIPAAVVAVIYAVLAILFFTAGGGHAIRSTSAPAEQKAPAAGRQAAQAGGGDTNFDTCTRLVHKSC
jgi:hypothetical protein